MDDKTVFKPFDSKVRGELAPEADIIDSPLVPGGGPIAGSSPLSRSFPGLTEAPSERRNPRIGLHSVRREGWISKRSQARRHFRDISSKAGATSENRVLSGLRNRGGLLALARRQAAHQRFSLRGHVRSMRPRSL